MSVVELAVVLVAIRAVKMVAAMVESTVGHSAAVKVVRLVWRLAVSLVG